MTTQMDKQPKTELELPLSKEKEDWLKSTIRDIPDFPKPGIIFKDVTTLMKHGEAFHFTLHALAQRVAKLNADVLVGIEARGFMLAPAIADILGKGFVPIRKPGKLPYKVERVDYALEYGTDTIEIHIDAIEKGQRVVLIDDLLATGGTAQAAEKLIEKVGGELVGVGFVIELGFLDGRSKLSKSADIFSLINYT
ncbi:adenine phosphoribosyltransferase [Candidatus Obscuribacterales bacterium]|nr:adenine phosphoribosyltransferase [Candidatus Obscuribacterales bacterium]MBX3134951.1 adenine phosphoribosyltransferase [Candidatus Obscuribacterales bacterium]MBX3150698.1 adenine phosphoribosyltransferase [Candidatus Obscuribacterales bacterium]